MYSCDSGEFLASFSLCSAMRPPLHPKKPYFELGVVSADGKKLIHKVDLQLKRLIKYNKEGYAQIGVMPRYGDSDSVKWFRVEPSCIFHIINCYEHGNEVVVLACRDSTSIIPGPDFGMNKFEWFSKRFKKTEQSEDESFFSRVYEWRLDMKTSEVTERNLTGIATVVHQSIQTLGGQPATKGANAEGVPKRLTYDEIQSQTYTEVKGSGTANQCPTIVGGVDGFAFKAGKYKAQKICLEPTSFTVKAESVNKNALLEFQNTKLQPPHDASQIPENICLLA